MGAFLFGRYSESHVEKEAKMNHTEMYSEDLDSFHRELSNGGLEIVVALLVHLGIDFVCAHSGKAIQM